MRFRNTCLRRYFVDSVFPAPDSPDTMIDWESFPLRNSLRARSPMEKTRRLIQSEHLKFISEAPIGEFPRRDIIFEGAHVIIFLKLSIIENSGYFKQAGTGPSRRHIQGSTSCEVCGKIDNAIREKETLYPNFQNVISEL